MPFLSSLSGIKDFTTSINPLNILNSIDNALNPPATPAATPAEAGPGPSTQAQRAEPKAEPPSPARPSLVDARTSSSDSSEGPSRRKTSNGVTIADADAPRRRARPISAGSGMTGLSDAKRKKKPTTDQYIIVRPPPTASKNPLNLQIQLVVRPTRDRERSESGLVSLRSVSTSTVAERLSSPPTPSTPTSELPVTPASSHSDTMPPIGDVGARRSDSPAPMSDDGAPLKRSSSRKSSLSTRSSATGSSYAGSKRIEPMFNLQVHNVMQPTVVTDAATDVKVAKFLKRAVDVTGVGIIEPSEVWLTVSNSSTHFPTLPGLDDGRRSRPVSMYSLNAAIPPSVTRVEEPRNKRGSLDLKHLSPEIQAQEGGAKRFFGKMFKRKGSQEFAAKQKSPSPSFSSGVSGNGHIASVPQPAAKSLNPAATLEHGVFVGPPTFGTSPVVVSRRSSATRISPDGAITGLTSQQRLVSSASNGSIEGAALLIAPSSRPVGYTWTVKRWAKKNTDGWAAHLVAAAAAGLEMVNGVLNGEEDEVVFEWVKTRSSNENVRRRLSIAGTVASGRSRSRPGSTRGDTPNPSPPHASLTLQLPRRSDSPLPASPSLHVRPEPVRRVSASASPNSRRPSPDLDNETSSVLHTADEGEESDPEDSETPWTCSIWVKRTGHRQLLGTLTPAPHHPKVIGVLKIPTKLDPVALTEVKGKQGASDMAKRVQAEVSLIEENLKDVVCVTAMWLVAREEFGGLGKKRRA